MGVDTEIVYDPEILGGGRLSICLVFGNQGVLLLEPLFYFHHASADRAKFLGSVAGV